MPGHTMMVCCVTVWVIKIRRMLHCKPPLLNISDMSKKEIHDATCQELDAPNCQLCVLDCYTHFFHIMISRRSPYGAKKIVPSSSCPIIRTYLLHSLSLPLSPGTCASSTCSQCCILRNLSSSCSDTKVSNGKEMLACLSILFAYH